MTLYISNLSPKMSEEIIYELFLQAGPIESVSLKGNFGFVTFEDEESVLYSCSLFEGVRLFDQELKIKPRAGSKYANHHLISVPPYLNGEIPIPSRGHSSGHLSQQLPRFFVTSSPLPNNFPYDGSVLNTPLIATDLPGKYATNYVFNHLSQYHRTVSYNSGSFSQPRSDFNGGLMAPKFHPTNFPPMDSSHQNSSHHLDHLHRSYSSGLN
ncbi:unnamed protein product [Schistocephalus solidus]|uniref:RNA-binding protein 7 n=1 Tax=Schistocephalus solidus TaxID=70667 RepID=A0A183SJ95_SCHSO|nr:unnamed protein product [Schistocephalus solidus]